MLLPSAKPPAEKTATATATPAIAAPLPFREESLSNGLQLHYYDQSNRYFGDYHRVRIVVEIEIALQPEFFVDPELLAAGIKRFGATLSTRKVLERMGVSSARVDSCRGELVASYQREVQSYLCHPDVPLRLLRAELAQKPSPSTVLRMLR